MESYDYLIQELLSQEGRNIRSNTFFLTAYYPIKKREKASLQKLKKVVLDWLDTHFRRNKDIGQFSRIHHQLLKTVSKHLENFEQTDKGLAIFAKFSASSRVDKRNRSIPKKQVLVVSLSRRPREEFSVGKTYDLDQLVWILNQKLESVVLNISRKKADVYILDEGKLGFITQVANDYLYSGEREYLEVHRPTRSDFAVYGTGSDRFKQRQKDEDMRFLTELGKYIKNEPLLKLQFEHLVVVYSHLFEEHIDDFIKNLTHSLPYLTPITIQKDIQTEKELHQEVLNTVNKHKEYSQKQQLKQAKKEMYKYIEDWQSVAKASRQRKINTLFITAKAKSPGYVLNRDLVYTHPAAGSRRVENIAPWIVHSALKADSQIVVFPESLPETETPIAASLRY
ncbi:MAG: hypothetical protein ACOX6V_01745 [Patescibacteria group bacterium]|jgi:hemerythrin